MINSGGLQYLNCLDVLMNIGSFINLNSFFILYFSLNGLEEQKLPTDCIPLFTPRGSVRSALSYRCLSLHSNSMKNLVGHEY